MFVGIQKRFGPYRLQTLTTQAEDGPECQQAEEGRDWGSYSTNIHEK